MDIGLRLGGLGLEPYAQALLRRCRRSGSRAAARRGAHSPMRDRERLEMADPFRRRDAEASVVRQACANCSGELQRRIAATNCGDELRRLREEGAKRGFHHALTAIDAALTDLAS
ncbi:hypothetical protein [Paraburkholderia azotifigens]|nr:hypothetical protein [Paraburkholderia azotifigens]TXC82618.1 hypothetical protein FRZ40_19385 [Paraburkholderia azotifigens]